MCHEPLDPIHGYLPRLQSLHDSTVISGEIERGIQVQDIYSLCDRLDVAHASDKGLLACVRARVEEVLALPREEVHAGAGDGVEGQGRHREPVLLVFSQDLVLAVRDELLE